jgi:hypothetical protein
MFAGESENVCKESSSSSYLKILTKVYSLTTFHILTVPSPSENEARYFPEFEKARHDTGALCPSRVFSLTAVLKSYKMILLSTAPIANL